MFKKIILGSLLIFTNLVADDVSIMPEIAKISYDNDSIKSVKNSANYIGIRADIDNDFYLIELYANYMDTEYKDYNGTKADNLVQSNIMGKYTIKLPYNTLTIGLDYLNSNESDVARDLGKGLIGMIGMEGYLGDDFDFFSFGIEIYYSAYSKAYDEVAKSDLVLVDIAQFTPYIVYDSKISYYKKNVLTLKATYVRASQYLDKNYISFEVSDTYTLYDWYVNLMFFGGDMKSGVMDSLRNIRGNRDLLNSIYSAKVGYHINRDLSVSAGYRTEMYNEYDRFKREYLDESRSTEMKLALEYKF